MKQKFHNEEWLKTEFVEKGRTLEDIAAEFDVSKQAVSLFVVRFGLGAMKRLDTPSYRNKAWLTNQIVGLEKSHQDIATEEGVHASTISKWAARLKVSKLPLSAAGKEKMRRRRNANQNERYLNDEQYRSRKIAASTAWAKNNKERHKANQDRYRDKKLATATK